MLKVSLAYLPARLYRYCTARTITAAWFYQKQNCCSKSGMARQSHQCWRPAPGAPHKAALDLSECVSVQLTILERMSQQVGTVKSNSGVYCCTTTDGTDGAGDLQWDIQSPVSSRWLRVPFEQGNCTSAQQCAWTCYNHQGSAVVISSYPHTVTVHPICNWTHPMCCVCQHCLPNRTSCHPILLWR